MRVIVSAFGILWLVKFIILNRLFAEIADTEPWVELRTVPGLRCGPRMHDRLGPRVHTDRDHVRGRIDDREKFCPRLGLSSANSTGFVSFVSDPIGVENLIPNTLPDGRDLERWNADFARCVAKITPGTNADRSAGQVLDFGDRYSEPRRGGP